MNLLVKLLFMMGVEDAIGLPDDVNGAELKRQRRSGLADCLICVILTVILSRKDVHIV